MGRSTGKYREVVEEALPETETHIQIQAALHGGLPRLLGDGDI